MLLGICDRTGTGILSMIWPFAESALLTRLYRPTAPANPLRSDTAGVVSFLQNPPRSSLFCFLGRNHDLFLPVAATASQPRPCRSPWSRQAVGPTRHLSPIRKLWNSCRGERDTGSGVRRPDREKLRFYSSALSIVPGCRLRRF
jgi:hypothetical protein